MLELTAAAADPPPIASQRLAASQGYLQLKQSHNHIDKHRRLANLVLGLRMLDPIHVHRRPQTWLDLAILSNTRRSETHNPPDHKTVTTSVVISAEGPDMPMLRLDHTQEMVNPCTTRTLSAIATIKKRPDR